MNPEMEGFHHGVDKCKETISNIVRSEKITNRTVLKGILIFQKTKHFRVSRNPDLLGILSSRDTAPKKVFYCHCNSQAKVEESVDGWGKNKKPQGSEEETQQDEWGQDVFEEFGTTAQ